MKNLINVICVLFCLGTATSILIAQENYLSGIEFSIDQDNFADFLHDSTLVDENHVVGLRLGIYGEVANSPILGLPWVRETVDRFLIDYALFNGDFREENTSHNFVFVVNGFSPQYISDNDDEMSFQNASLDGYRLQLDRPFSSFTGFRSTRRIEGIKRFSHSAIVLDLAINTSFTFGFASWGLAQNIDNLFGSNRPNANLWDREHPEKQYPTGQLMRPFVPLFMYSVSAEAVIWRPIRQVVAQVRPELNLGYYTNIGVGLDLGKVMNVEKHVDNLSYTDTNNPGTLKVNDNFLSIAFSAGIMSRFVLYNAHINGFFSKKNRANYDYGTRRLVLEAYAGVKLQMFKKLEFNFSVNGRTSEFGSPQANSPIWGTFGMKYLIAEEGAGCYN